MNYLKQINELKTCRIQGDYINIELMAIDTQIHKLRLKRAEKVLKIACIIVIFSLGIASLIF